MWEQYLERATYSYSKNLGIEVIHVDFRLEIPIFGVLFIVKAELGNNSAALLLNVSIGLHVIRGCKHTLGRQDFLLVQ